MVDLFLLTENKTRNHPFLMAKNRSKKYKECFIKRRTADVQEIFLFCCLSKKIYILCCPINRCKVSHHYFALLVDLSSFLKQNMSYANVVLVFHSPMRTSKNVHITNAKRTNICQVGFSTDTRTDPFFVVAENSVTESVYFGEPV